MSNINTGNYSSATSYVTQEAENKNQRNEDIFSYCATLLVEFMQNNIESFRHDTQAQQANLLEQQKNTAAAGAINSPSTSSDEISALLKSTDEKDITRLQLILDQVSLDQTHSDSVRNVVSELGALLRQEQGMLSTSANQKSNSVTETQGTIKGLLQTVIAMVNQSSR